VAGLADSRADDPAAGGGKNVDGPGEVLAEGTRLRMGMPLMRVPPQAS
jgi:hypothetical protein